MRDHHFSWRKLRRLLSFALLLIAAGVFLFLKCQKKADVIPKWDELPGIDVYEDIELYGGWEQTRAVYDSVLAQAQNWDRWLVLLKIGILQESVGNLDSAQIFLENALARSPGRSQRAVILLRLGVLHGKLGDIDEAENYFGQAQTIGAPAWGDSLQACYLSYRANLHFIQERFDEAISNYQDALRLYQLLRLERGEWICLLSLGVVHAEKGEYAAAQQWYNRADSTAWGQRDSFARAGSALNRGELYRQTGAITSALQEFRRARENIFDAGGRDLEVAEIDWAARLGEARCLWALGKRQQAKTAAEESIAILEKQMLRVSSDAMKRNYLEQRRGAFEEMVGIYLGLQQYRLALEAAERGRSRAFLDLLQERGIHLRPPDELQLAPLRQIEHHQTLLASADAEVRDMSPPTALRSAPDIDLSPVLKNVHPELRSLSAVTPVRFDAIARLAKEKRTTLVEYFALEDSLAIFVISPNGRFVCRTTRVSHDSLKNTIAELLKMITAPQARTNWRNIQPADATPSSLDHRRGTAVSQQLYNWLIAPIAAFLPADTSEVVTIVPHRELFLVPFPALMDSNQKYLIEKHPLATVPAAGVLQFTGQKRGMVVSAGQPQLLSVGDPLYPANSGLQPLRGARVEAGAIAELFPEDRRNFLQDREASESEIKRKAPAFTILHFATHGILNERQPMLSALALAADSLDDGFLTCAEIFALPQLHADLIVLSACQTGRGEITGDGILGLSRAFLYAGTPALIATQWSIDDESTSFLMSTFYSEYRQSRRKALALRRAQLRTLAKYPAPFYWAAFVLVGED